MPPFGGDPLVVDVEEDGTAEADDRRFVGKDAHNTTPTLQFLVEPLERIGRPDLAPVLGGEGGEGQYFLLRFPHQSRALCEPVLQGGCHLVPLGVHVGARHLSETVLKAADTMGW